VGASEPTAGREGGWEGGSEGDVLVLSLWKKCEEQGVPVWVHPNRPQVGRGREGGREGGREEGMEIPLT